MKLTKKYALGVLVQFYEIEMFKTDYIDGLLNMLKDIENPENITFDFVYNLREDFEKIDTDAILLKEDSVHNGYLYKEFYKATAKIEKLGSKVNHQIFDLTYGDPPAIAWYRRDFNYRYADKVDFLMWGETDSVFPSQTFEAIEQISTYAEQNKICRYVISFAYRKMWDAGWKAIEHPEFTNVVFEDTDEWNLHNPASEKCYMSIKQMNELNERYSKDGYDIISLNEPKFDGSCVVFSSDLIKMGVNIPHALLMSGEDTSFAVAAKQMLGDNYIQFHIKNLLRIHNRRHPKKRMYVKNENNPQGFCGTKDKGMWWTVLVQWSKENLNNLYNPQFKFHTWDEYFTSMIQQGFLK